MRATTNPDGKRYYRDTAREHDVKCEHGRMSPADFVEAQVMARLSVLRLPDEWKKRITQLAAATVADPKLEEKRRVLNSKLERLQKLFLKGDLSEEEYDRQRKRVAEELERFFKQQPELKGERSKMLEDSGSILARSTPEERKRIISMLIRSVYVDAKQVSIEPRQAFTILFDEQARKMKS
jgi:hypothetical protein